MQRIVIKNFGPIKDVDIPIHDFMIFIGPQASGKSTIARAIDFLKESPAIFFQFVTDLNLDKLSKEGNDFIDAFLKQLAIEYHTSLTKTFRYFGDFKMSAATFYYDVEKDLSYSYCFDKPEIAFSENLHALFSNFLENLISNNESFKNDPRLFNRIVSPKAYDFISEYLGRNNISTFIPAGRTIFSVLSDNFIVDNRLGNLYNYKIFASILNQIKLDYERRFDPQVELIETFKNQAVISLAERCIFNILKGKYERIAQRDFIQIDDNFDILLDFASSGQQESIWILLALLESIKNQTADFFIIEEPEAHLYPEAQKYMTELIVLCVNQRRNQAIITTHSPYILSSLNNLLSANEIGKKHPEKVDKVVDKNLWLDYDRVMAYFVDKGEVTSIMDEEMKMIKSEEIDSASRIINEQYDELLKIEYNR